MPITKKKIEDADKAKLREILVKLGMTPPYPSKKEERKTKALELLAERDAKEEAPASATSTRGGRGGAKSRSVRGRGARGGRGGGRGGKNGASASSPQDASDKTKSDSESESSSESSGSAPESSSSEQSSDMSSPPPKKQRVELKSQNKTKVADSPEQPPRETLRLVFGASSIRGRRNQNEDVHLMTQDGSSTCFAVYDGHGGISCAEFLREHLHKEVLSSPYFPEQFNVAASNGCKKVEEDMYAQGKVSDVCGSTAALVIINEKTLFCANVGDAEVVLGYVDDEEEEDEFKALELSRVVGMDDPFERRRIEAGGGRIFRQGPLRVCVPGVGDLSYNLCRTFGDRVFKAPKYNPTILSAEPLTQQTTLSRRDKFVVLSCDGLYELGIFGHQEVIDFVGKHIKDQRAALAKTKKKRDLDVDSIAAALTKEAERRGSGDNITAVIAVFVWE